MRFAKLPKPILARDDLSASDKIVYAVILDAGNGEAAAIGIRRIMETTAMSSHTVQRSIRNVERAGLLSIDRGRNGQRQTFKFPSTVQQTATVKKDRPYQKLARSRCKNATEAYQNLAHVETDLSRDAAPRGVHQQLIDFFTERWGEQFGGKYPFDKRKDPPAAKRLLEAVSGDLARAKRLVSVYLDSGDQWTRDRGSGLALLCSSSQLSRYLARTAPAAEGPSPAPSDHPVIESAREKWPEAVAADPAYWAELAHRADDPRSGVTTVGLQRLILKSASVEKFKAAVPTPRKGVAGA